ncbi:anthranilate phosphoribosyltransferase [Microscilla marina]|uniref:Anthranilate phosphoribosyltransferase n=1 Tax=Microscilla marina ATCC 23134 TaxID=313606 RepID=A1ZFH4_MICM2|nr:anthranilate phosphoribosyltransferase [Microscilla marina]EAY30748.1 anthranilate phosphoribosyltransferase [Microscilla marina ATCC 23134]
MKAILNHLFEHKKLTKDEAREVLTNIAQGKYNHSQIAAFLTVYIMRSISVEELEGFREAMLNLCIPVHLNEYNPIDLCGTGGDGKNTFNVSTLASFVTAASGVHVAKHGNHGVSSVSGSSTVLEYFGVKFTNDKDKLRRQIEEANICFLHAPLFHPAMKNVAPIRKELKVKTFFNMLGPMVNPAFPKNQLVGVFSLELARLYAYLYQKLDKSFRIVHSLDGYDEVSLTGKVKTYANNREQLFTPEDLGFEAYQPEDLFGGDTVAASAKIFEGVLKNDSTQAQKDVVCANAGLAIHTARPELSLIDAVALAQESLTSGKALQTFERFLTLSKEGVGV